MENKWLKYLSDQNNEELIPIMEQFFNDEIDLMELNDKVCNLGLLDFSQFKKEKNIDDILNG